MVLVVELGADLFANKAGNGAPTFQKGVAITGVE